MVHATDADNRWIPKCSERPRVVIACLISSRLMSLMSVRMLGGEAVGVAFQPIDAEIGAHDPIARTAFPQSIGQAIQGRTIRSRSSRSSAESTPGAWVHGE